MEGEKVGTSIFFFQSMSWANQKFLKIIQLILFACLIAYVASKPQEILPRQMPCGKLIFDIWKFVSQIS